MPEATKASPSTRKPWQGLANEAFRQAIAQAERSAEHDFDGYLEHHRGTNALGRYQLTPIALLEAKWKIGDRWADKARAFGVNSDDDFKSNPAAQEAALADVIKDYERQVRAKNLLSHVGQTYTGVSGNPVKISEAGLIAAAHREGAGATSRYLRRRVNGIASDDPRAREIDLAIETRLRAFAAIPYERGAW